MIEAIAQKLQLGFAAPIYLMLHNGDVRFYWAYLAVVPLILLFLKWRGGAAAATISSVWAKATWLSASARVDIWIFVLNGLLRFALLSGLFISSALIAAVTAKALINLGVRQTLDGTSAPLIAIFTITTFIAADFGKFLAHYLAHRVPALWELHKVHHAAEVLNPFTAERFHPIEEMVSALVIGVILGGVTGLIMAMAGPTLHPWTIAGANVFWVLANLAGGVLRHMPVWVSYGPKVEHWILSPAQHQIHHSDAAHHFDKNLGATLAVWDRLFGTLYVTHGVEPIRYGLGEETARFRSVAENYWRPIANLWAMAGKALGAHPPIPEQPKPLA